MQPPRPYRPVDATDQIPQRQVANCARQYREAASFMSQRLTAHGTVLPLLTLAGLGLELYLKSLDATTRYTQDEQLRILGGYLMTAESNERGHNLVALFDALGQDIRDRLEAGYAAFDGRVPGATFREAIEPYQCLFVRSRYAYEANANLGGITLPGPVRLLEFLGDWADERIE